MISPSRGHDPRFVEQHLECDPASTRGAFAGEHSCMVFVFACPFTILVVLLLLSFFFFFLDWLCLHLCFHLYTFLRKSLW